jgi:hypothetical protein
LKYYSQNINRPRIKFVVYFGDRVKAQTASSLFASLKKWIDKRSDSFAAKTRKESGEAKGVKMDYVLGFLKGLREQYEEQRADESYALVVTVSKEVENAYNEIAGLHTAYMSSTIRCRYNMDAQNAGYNDGKHYGKALESV